MFDKFIRDFTNKVHSQRRPSIVMSGMVDSRDQYLEGDPRRPSSLAPDLRAAPRKVDKGRAPYQEEGEGGGGETDKYAGLGIGVAGLLAENLACHPFIVLRRQCQVNVASRRAHTTPLTLLPVFVNLYKWQGVAVLRAIKHSRLQLFAQHVAACYAEIHRIQVGRRGR